MTTYLIPTVERPIWPGSPLAKIVDVLNYACAQWNGKKDKNSDNEDEWKGTVKQFIEMNKLDDPCFAPFAKGFGGHHLWLNDLDGERCYIIYAQKI